MNRVFIAEYSSTEYQWKLRLQAPTIWRGRGRVGGTGGKRKGKGDFGVSIGGGFQGALDDALMPHIWFFTDVHWSVNS